MSDSISSLSLKALQNGIVAGDFSSMEVTEHFLDRIETFDPALNSYLTVTKDVAMQQAIEADNAIRAGEIKSPLAGIPYALKDLYCTQGIRTTAASKILDNFISPYDATVQTKLRQAGAVLLGKNNMGRICDGFIQ